MFKFQQDYEFEWDVSVSYPGQSGEIESSFKARFKLPDDELDLYHSIDAKNTVELIEKIRKRVSEYLVGWSGISVDQNGQVVDYSYSEANKEKLLAQRPVREAIDKAFFEAVTGIREKN